MRRLLVTALLFVLPLFAQNPQAPPATPDQNGSAAAPSVGSPSPVIPVKPSPGVAQPQAEITPDKNATPAPALNGNVRVKRVAMMDVNGAPGFNGAAFVNGFLVMSHSANNSVDIFNVAKRRMITQIKDMQGAAGIAVDPKGEVVYVANPDGNNIAVLATSNWQVARRIETKDSPNGLLLTPDGQLYSASFRQQTISQIDPAQGKVLNTVAIDGSPEHMAFDSQRKQLFATLEAQNALAVLDPALKVVRRFKLNASEPTGIAYDAKANRLYVAVRYAVLALDPDSGRELGRIAAPAGVDSMVLNPSGDMLYAAAEGGSVQIIRLGGQFAVEQEINTDVRGHTIAYDPQTQMLFMPGGREGRSKLLLLKQVSMSGPAPAQTASK